MGFRGVLARSPAAIAFATVLAVALITLQYRQLRKIFDDLAPGAKTGETAPALEFSGLKGEPIVTTGRPTVVSFWAAWCAPCRHEMPELATAVANWNEKAADQDKLQLILVNQGDDPESLSMFVNDARLSKATFALDPQGAMKDRWKVRVLPTTYLVGHKGQVAYYQEGYTPYVMGGLFRAMREESPSAAKEAKP